MITINIWEFYEYETFDIFEFLMFQEDISFQVVIPRTLIKVSPEEMITPINYISAAYAGHLLSELATDFAYYVPCPLKEEPFRFHVTIPDLVYMAELLYTIVDAFNPGGVEDSFMAFQDQADEFHRKAYEEDAPCNTMGLLEVANELLYPDE